MLNIDFPPETSGTTWRRFWCRTAGRNVEVALSTHGVPALRIIDGVRSCSAFFPCTAVACARQCVNAEFRRAPWDFPIPIRRRR
jgi:hypothetical protein